MIQLYHGWTAHALLALGGLVGAMALAPPPLFPAMLAACDQENTAQQWHLRTQWGAANTLVDTALSPGDGPLCLDVWDWQTANNSVTQAFHCCCANATECPVPCEQPLKNCNQMWSFVAESATIVSGCGASMCLTAAANHTSQFGVGSAVVIYTCGAAPAEAQQWQLQSDVLRLLSDTTLCVTTQWVKPPSPPPPTPPPGPCAGPSAFPFCNHTLPIIARAADLVGRLTPAEKITQLSTYSFTSNHSGFTPGVPRLGIAAFNYHTEGLHGVRGSCDTPSTLYPQVTAMAATGNMSLVLEMAEVMGRQFRAAANVLAKKGTGPLHFGCGLSVYGPTLNIIRDPRFTVADYFLHVSEYWLQVGSFAREHQRGSFFKFVYGIYAANFVKGVQGDYDAVGYLQVAATCKHLVAYSQETDRQTTSMANLSTLDLHETYLPAFEACVKAGAQQVMCSYNRITITDGPTTANGTLPGTGACFHGDIQTGIIRGLFTFNGSIVSDCDALLDHENLYASRELAVAAGLGAGCDMDCGEFYSAYGLQALEQGMLPESAVDQALIRVFSMRFKLGEFDSPDLVPYTKIPGGISDDAFSRDSALRAAQEAICLLQNNISLLPLEFSPNLTVAVVGPAQNNAEIMFGEKTDYQPAFVVTVAQGLVARGVRVLNESGCADIACQSSAGFTAAIALARKADIVIAAMGIDKSIEAENLDRTTTDLPGLQTLLLQELLAAVGAAKMIVVLVNGGSVSADWVKFNVPTVVEAFEGGQSAGTALAGVIFGDVNPSGVLPYTVYPSDYVNAIRMDNYEMRPNATTQSPGRTYRFYTGQPLWPFGHGLSYSNFSMAWAGPAHVNVSRRGDEPWAAVTINVTNNGPRAGAVVVQAFVAGGSPAGLLRTLFGVQKVFLQVNDSQLLTFATDTFAKLGYCPLCAVNPATGRQERGDIAHGNSSQPIRRTFIVGNGRDTVLSTNVDF